MSHHHDFRAHGVVALAVMSAALIAVGDVRAEIQVGSIAELRAVAGVSNETVKLAPGNYDLAGINGNRSFLEFTGTNTTFDFTDVTFTVDTQSLREYGGGNINGVNLMWLKGTEITVQGFTLDTVQTGSTVYTSDSETIAVKMGGTNNTLRDVTINTAGSTPYGFGDAFGKGGRPANGNQPGGVPFKAHRKSSGVQVYESTGATIDGLTLNMNSFGHGIFMQKASDIRILNSTITGQLASSNDVINDPQYQEYGHATYGQPLPPDINISKSEDGVRSYGVIDGVPVENVHVENVVVRNMREAYSLMDAQGTKTVINSEAWGNETGFEPGTDTTIINSRGDATNGPLLYFRRTNITNANVELELVQTGPQVGTTWDVAYISGNDNHITLTGEPGPLSDDAVVRVSQRWNDWRHDQRDLNDAPNTRRLSIINVTGQHMVIGPNANEGGQFRVEDGNVLGGSGRISTATGSNIHFDSDGILDPRGALTFDVGAGEVDVRFAINNETGALKFALDDVADSDSVSVLGYLNIGDGLLGFEDFDFTLGTSFGPGVYTLFESDRPIDGSLSGNLTGELAGRAASLNLGNGDQSIQLNVIPEPQLLGLLGASVLALRRRKVSAL